MMAKGFSGIFPKRYPDAIIIPIMQTGAEGRIAFCAYFFYPISVKTFPRVSGGDPSRPHNADSTRSFSPRKRG